MAWIVELEQRAGVAYKVRWREGTRAVRNRNFRERADAEQFRDEMNVRYPSTPPRRVLMPLKMRIWANVHVDAAGCWQWQRTKQREGYGQLSIRVEGQQKTVLAHRVSYEQFAGPIPDGLQLDHLCRVRSCVNPDHLEPVTGSENIRRSPIHISVRTRKDVPGAPCSAARHGTAAARQNHGCCCIEAFEDGRRASRAYTARRRLARVGGAA